MFDIAITPELLDAIRNGGSLPWRAITTAEFPGGEACLACGEERLPLIGLRHKRIRLSELFKESILDLCIGTRPDAVLAFLAETGQAATPETEVTLFSWDKLSPGATPIVSTRQSGRPMNSTAVTDTQPDMALEAFLVPFDQARDGDPVALSVPFERDGIMWVDGATVETGLVVLVRDGAGLAARSIADMPEAFAAGYEDWIAYGRNINDWTFWAGAEACRYLTPFLGRTFTATAFFFTDCAVAVSTEGSRYLAVALPCDQVGLLPKEEATLPEAIATRLAGWDIWPTPPQLDDGQS